MRLCLQERRDGSLVDWDPQKPALSIVKVIVKVIVSGCWYRLA